MWLKGWRKCSRTVLLKLDHSALFSSLGASAFVNCSRWFCHHWIFRWDLAEIERERMLPGWLHHRRARLSFLSSSEIIIHLYMQLKGPGLNDAGRIMHVKCLNRAVDLALHFWTLPQPLKPYRWHAQEGRQAGLESVWHITTWDLNLYLLYDFHVTFYLPMRNGVGMK